MIESVSGIGSASVSAGVRSPVAAAAPAQGPSFDQALAQVVGSAVDTLQSGEAVARLQASFIKLMVVFSISADCLATWRLAS